MPAELKGVTSCGSVNSECRLKNPERGKKLMMGRQNRANQTERYLLQIDKQPKRSFKTVKPRG
jgi:hypothetical protein